MRHGATAPRTLGARFRPKMDGLDNTVGLVPKISGYVFNTHQRNSAAHVPNTNMNPIYEGTHICDRSLYETIFQNWCIIDSLPSMTPAPDANAFSDALKEPSFTDSNSTHCGDALSEDNSRDIKIAHFTDATNNSL